MAPLAREMCDLPVERHIDHLSADYAIRSLDAAGDTLQNMFNKQFHTRVFRKRLVSPSRFS
jgi:hypothetical protein